MSAKAVLTPTAALQLANPRSWVASMYPAVLGLGYCLALGDGPSILQAVALFVAVIAMQSAVNTFNDYYDFVKGADSQADYVEVTDAALVYGQFPPRQALWLAIGFLAAAGILAVPVAWSAGPAPFIIGCMGALVVWSYSGGALPISYWPLGEVMSGSVMGGFIPLGIVAAITGRYEWSVIGLAAPLIISIALIMLTNNTCDIEKDRRAGRRTLPVLLGRKRAVLLYRAGLVSWLLTSGAVTVWCLGWSGFFVPIVMLISMRKPLAYLWQTPLQPTERIQNMKAIVKANYLGGAMYVLSWLVVWGGLL